MTKENLIEEIKNIIKQNEYISGIDFGNLQNFEEETLISILGFYEAVVQRYQKYSDTDKRIFLEALNKASIDNISLLTAAITQKKIAIIRHKETQESTNADELLQSI